MSMKMKGFDDLLKKLSRLERHGAKRANRKAVRAGTTKLLQAVRAQVPRDKGVLKKMMASKIAGKRMKVVGVVGADNDMLKAATKHLPRDRRPSNIDHLVEFGHVSPDGTFVPPDGFMRRGAASGLPAAESAYINKLATEIEREAMK